ncbi:MAG: YidC/Oxa1 family membrane protein insertase [Candidatus Gastranaerophilaceae bacterium]
MFLSITLFSIKIYNYALLIIILTLLVKGVRTLLDKVNAKQAVVKKERNAKIKQFQEESKDKDELTDKIYNYYKETNYNPFLSVFLSVLMIVLDFAIISMALATFNPISNFKIIEPESTQSIVSIYREGEGDSANKYTEIRLLKDLETYEDKYIEAGVSQEEINTLYEFRDTFKLGSFETYIVPSMNKITLQSLPCLLTFGVFAANTLWLIIIHLKQFIKVLQNNKKEPLEILMGAFPLMLDALTVALVSSLIFNTPIVISFYFLINYSWMLITKIINACKRKKSQNNVEVKAKVVETE